MTTPEFATLSEFASIAGFKRSYITALKQAGRIVLTEDGKRVRVADSLALIDATRDPSKIGVARRHAAARAASAAVQASTLDSETDPDEPEPAAAPDSPYHVSRAEREGWLAKAARRDYEISIGTLMDAGEVEAAVANAGVALRKAIERLPDVLAPQLAPLTDETIIRTLLADAVEHALHDLARQFAAIAKQVAA